VRRDNESDPRVTDRLAGLLSTGPAVDRAVAGGAGPGGAGSDEADSFGAGVYGVGSRGVGSDDRGGFNPDVDDVWRPRPAAAARVAPAVLAALNPGRKAVKALAGLALAVILVTAFLAWHDQPRAEVVATTSGTASPGSGRSSGVAPAPDPPLPGTVSSSSLPSGTALSGTAPSGAAMIVVAVSGKVRHPGLVHLPSGSRVADAIAAAGGALPGTDLSFVNLARKVADGELIVIGIAPSPGSIVDGGGEPSDGPAAGGLVDINTADATQLDILPGIGPALAQRIIDYRTQHGPFHSIDGLQQVSGIGEAKYAAIKDLVTV
jgi:competence protein ComEA